MDKNSPDNKFNLSIFDDILKELKRISQGINQRGGVSSDASNTKGNVVDELKKISSAKQPSKESKASLVKDFLSFGIGDIFKAKLNEFVTNIIFPSKTKANSEEINQPSSSQNSVTSPLTEETKQKEPVLVKIVSDELLPAAAEPLSVDETKEKEPLPVKVVSVEENKNSNSSTNKIIPFPAEASRSVLEKDTTIEVKVTNFNELLEPLPSLFKKSLVTSGLTESIDSLSKKVSEMEAGEQKGGLLKTLLGIGAGGGGLLGLKRLFGKKVGEEVAEKGGKKLAEEVAEKGGKKLLEKEAEKGGKSFISKIASKAKPVLKAIGSSKLGKALVVGGAAVGAGKYLFDSKDTEEEGKNEEEQISPESENNNSQTEAQKQKEYEQNTQEKNVAAATIAGTGVGIEAAKFGYKKLISTGVEKGATKLGAKAAGSTVPLLGSVVSAGVAVNDYAEASKIKDDRLRTREQARAIGSGVGGVAGGTVGFGAGLVLDQAVGQIAAGSVDTYFAAQDLALAVKDLYKTKEENSKKEIQVKYESIAQKLGLLKNDPKLKEPDQEQRRKKIEKDLEVEITNYNKVFKSKEVEERTVDTKVYPKIIEKSATDEMAQEGWEKTQQRRKSTGYYNKPENKNVLSVPSASPPVIAQKAVKSSSPVNEEPLIKTSSSNSEIISPQNVTSKQTESSQSTIVPSQDIVPVNNNAEVPPIKDSSSTFNSMDGSLEEISKNTQMTNQSFRQLLGAVENLTNAVLKQNASNVTVNSFTAAEQTEETLTSYAAKGNPEAMNFRAYNQSVRPMPA